jgi:hypothetical protein
LKVLQEEKQKQLIGKQNFGIKLEIKYWNTDKSIKDIENQKD